MPLPLPVLPTDNLYKFAAICSLCLFLIGAIAPEILYREEHIRLPHVVALLRRIEYTPPEERNKEPYRTTLAEAFGSLEEGNAEWDLYISYQRYGNILCLASLVGMFFGFRLWYTRVQKPLDDALKKSAMNTPNSHNEASRNA